MLFIVCLLVWGCASGGVSPEQSQLQIREFQTRSYDTKDTLMVLKALLNVLQDEKFIVQNADKDLGLLSASKEVDVHSDTQVASSVLTRIMLGFCMGGAFGAVKGATRDARWKKNSVIECSGNVSEFGEETRVRINFQMKTLNNKNEVVDIKQIEDPKYYQDFFSKVDKGIFIEKEGI
jgi:hypothetical protein